MPNDPCAAGPRAGRGAGGGLKPRAVRADTPGMTPPTTLLSPAAPPTAPAATGPTGSAAPAAHRVLREELLRAVDADARWGTATGLLLLAVDGTAADDDCAGAVAQRLRTAVRSRDRWLTLGGRSHALLLVDLPPALGEASVDRAADALLHALESAERTAPQRTGLRVSVGAGLAAGGACDADDLLDLALDALAAARAAGGHCARLRTA